MNSEKANNNQQPMQSPLKGKFQNLKNNEAQLAQPKLQPVQGAKQAQVPPTENSTPIQQTTELKPVTTKSIPANVTTQLAPIEDKVAVNESVAEVQGASPLKRITREKFASAFKILFVVLFSGITFFGGIIVQQELINQEAEILPDANVNQYVDPNIPSYTNNMTYEELIDFTDWYADPKDSTFLFRGTNNKQETIDGYELLDFGFTSLEESKTLLLEFESYVQGYDWVESSGNSLGSDPFTGIKKGYQKADKFIIIDYREYKLTDSIESKLIINFN